MKHMFLRIALLAVASAGLSACFGGGGKSTPTPTTPPQAAKFEDQFGPVGGFATAYGQPANSEPRDVNAGDVVPVNPASEPVNLPGT